jgi:hypothetical protein
VIAPSDSDPEVSRDHDRTRCCHDDHQCYEGGCRSVPPMGHQWAAATLICERGGCETSWESHQETQQKCRGGKAPRPGRAGEMKAEQFIAQTRRRRVILPLYHLYRWSVKEIHVLFPGVVEGTIRRDIRGRTDNVSKGIYPPDRVRVLGVEAEPDAWAPLSKPRVGRNRGTDSPAASRGSR